MSKRVAIALAVVLVAAVTALGGAAVAAADDTPALLSPDAATALAGTPGTPSVSPTVVVDPNTALAAASASGAVTAYESDMTLDEAVGLDPTSSTSSTSTASSPSTLSIGTLSVPKTCWSSSVGDRWGTWPYEQKLTETSYWCAIYGQKVTYLTSSITGGGTICGLSWRASQLISGGVGFPYFTMRSSAGWSCPTTIPWFVLHPSHYLDVKRNDVGVTAVVGYG
jgi:hypothetical protein